MVEAEYALVSEYHKVSKVRGRIQNVRKRCTGKNAPKKAESSNWKELKSDEMFKIYFSYMLA